MSDSISKNNYECIDSTHNILKRKKINFTGHIKYELYEKKSNEINNKNEIKYEKIFNNKIMGHIGRHTN